MAKVFALVPCIFGVAEGNKVEVTWEKLDRTACSDRISAPLRSAPRATQVSSDASRRFAREKTRKWPVISSDSLYSSRRLSGRRIRE